MAEPTPIRINARTPSSGPVRLRVGNPAERTGNESANPPLPVPIPPQALGQLSALPTGRLLPATLEVLQKIHGGWGWLLFRVESPVALSAAEMEGERESPTPEIAPEAITVSPELNQRYHHAAPELALLASEAAAKTAASTGKPTSEESELAGQRCVVQALPLFEGESLVACLCRIQSPEQRGEAGALAGLQLAGLLRLLGQAREEEARVRSRFGKVAAFVELLASAEGGTDFAECSRRLANHLREVLECDTVALAVRHFGRNRLAAVSGETGPAESHSPGRRALLGHLTETIHRRQPLLSKRDRTTGESGAAILGEWFDPALSYCLPLIDAEGNLRGGWLFLWNETPDDFEEKEALIKAASPEVAPLLSLLHKAKPGPAVGSVIRLWKRGTTVQRRLIGTVAALAGLTLLVPLPYPVKSTCELQPVVRRVIAAPFDGILQRSSVRAGDTVTKGQLLAELDGREVRSELAEAVARRERARKEADEALAADRIAEARMATLEAESLDHEIERLEYRQEHLQVRAPIDGLVLQGDLERSEGAPLRMGDPLFEVGPLDRLLVEFAVDATDISLVESGASARLKLESYSGDRLETEILRVSPKSEWRSDRNVFICEAEIDNPNNTLRAGLEGKGKIEGPRRPLAWIWLRNAWLAARYHLW
ncbi:MAG: HlyD family efflux transporter periplasmic adaptor subunit [Verrucomicrobiae bacterium]|nr:HlyD family efflux transporter periplasmic adaptor subunit [Verrucomicrobiae bacterium]